MWEDAPPPIQMGSIFWQVAVTIQTLSKYFLDKNVFPLRQPRPQVLMQQARQFFQVSGDQPPGGPRSVALGLN